MSKKRNSFTEEHKQYYLLIFSAVYAKIEDVDDKTETKRLLSEIHHLII